MIVALLLFSRLAPSVKLKRDDAVDLFLFGVPLGVIVARLLYVIANARSKGFFPLDNFSDFLYLFAIWEGGVTIMGGIIGGLLGGWLFCKKKKVPFFEIMGAAVICLIIAQSIGKWGNFVNQELFGKPVTSERWQFFPFAVFIEASEAGKHGSQAGWHYAAFFYESMLCLIGGITMLILFKKVKYKGTIVFVYIVWYYTTRFLMELIRMGSSTIGNSNFSWSMLACILFVPVGILGILTYNKHGGHIPWLKFLQKERAGDYYNPDKVEQTVAIAAVEAVSAPVEEAKSPAIRQTSAKDMAKAYDKNNAKKK
jgi:phosphatidylglycerol:prolipoprotein diacylglycerol transferase